MKKFLIIFSAVIMVLGMVGSSSAAVIYNYDSLLDVDLSIMDLGSSYSYQFDFDNTDSSEIWHFIVWAEETVYSGTTTFPNGLDINLPLDSVNDVYDARNLDANLGYLNNMWYSPFATNGLAIGDSASLSFESTFYFDSFLYGYETLSSGYAATNGGNIAAIGTAVAGAAPVPEPSTILLMGAGLLGLVGYNRKRFSTKS